MEEIKKEVKPFVTFANEERQKAGPMEEDKAIFEADRLLREEAEAKLAKIKEANKNNATNFVTFKDEDKGKSSKFLLLLVGSDPQDGEEWRHWEIVTGRQEAYDTIKGYIETLDVVSSTITVEVETITQRKRVIDFLRYVLESGKIEDPGFDPMDYVKGDLVDFFEDEDEEEIVDEDWYKQYINGEDTN